MDFYFYFSSLFANQKKRFIEEQINEEDEKSFFSLSLVK